MPVLRDQAQFGGPLRGSSTIVCGACNIVYDPVERVPKLLLCCHVFCVMCLHSMTRGDYVLCFICGRPTPAPRDLAWLPTYTEGLPQWRVPNGRRSERRRPPVRSTIWSIAPNRAQDHLRNPNGNFNLNGANSSAWSPPSVYSQQAHGRISREAFSEVRQNSATGAYGEQHPREVGMPLVPYSNRELLHGLELPHVVSNALSMLWNEPADDVNGSNGGNSEPQGREFASRRVLGSQMSSRVESDEHPLLLDSNRHRSATPSYSIDPDQINRMTRVLNDLVQTLEMATNIYRSYERRAFTRYFQSVRNSILQDISDSQSPHFFFEAIREMKAFLTEVRRVEGAGRNDQTIFNFCMILTYQQYKRYLEHVQSSEFTQGDNMVNATIQDSRALNLVDLNGNVTALVDVQTQTEWWDILDFSEGYQESALSESDASEAGAVGREVAIRRRDENNLDTAVSLPFNLTVKHVANIYFMDFKMAGHGPGRVVIETFPALTPLMSANFAVLCSGTGPVSYRGCRVFQCWNGQSIISGDTESNTGNGGKSILNHEFFEPDEQSFIPPVRGTIGMRRLARSPKGQKGKVSSQFRILLTHQPKITGLFGYVISGIEVVDKISQLDDGKGNPRRKVFISDCGKLNF